MTVPINRVIAAAAEALKPIPLPPPISQAERIQRIARARQLLQQNGIGSVIVESGSSLDYLTGVQWQRSERLTAAVIPAQGDPIIVTPFFESPSIAEMLAIPAEIRTWNEDEDPLKLVADFLKERGVASQPVGFEETDRYFILDRLGEQLPRPQGRHRQSCRSRTAPDQITGGARADANRQRHHAARDAACRRERQARA